MRKTLNDHKTAVIVKLYILRVFGKESSMVKKRNSRQDTIRDIVRGKSIRTQRALVQELTNAGFN